MKFEKIFMKINPINSISIVPVINNVSRNI